MKLGKDFRYQLAIGVVTGIPMEFQGGANGRGAGQFVEILRDVRLKPAFTSGGPGQ